MSGTSSGRKTTGLALAGLAALAIVAVAAVVAITANRSPRRVALQTEATDSGHRLAGRPGGEAQAQGSPAGSSQATGGRAERVEADALTGDSSSREQAAGGVAGSAEGARATSHGLSQGAGESAGIGAAGPGVSAAGAADRTTTGSDTKSAGTSAAPSNSVSRSGEETAGDADKRRTEQAEGEEGEARATPVPGALISGVVTDPDGNPFARAAVAVSVHGTGYAMTAMTNIDGKYRLFPVVAGTVAISVSVPPESSFAPPETRVFDLAAGEERTGENFVLLEADVIEGLVLNEAGEPIETAAIEALIRGRTAKQLSDADGRFRIRGLQPGWALDQLTVSHPDYQSETRSRLTMLDGLQTFTLRRTNRIVLSVFWSFDNTPVIHYAYRLLKEGPLGYVDVGKQSVRVDAPDGRTTLEELAGGLWRAEVTVLSPEGEPTEIRGAAEIRLGSGSQGMEIPIAIDGGRTIAGVVTLDQEGGSPVEGATLEFVPPNAGFGRFPKPDAPFLLQAQTTDASGRFAFPGMPPGRYILTAKKDNLLTPQAVQIDVPYTSDPQPASIVMVQGGVVFGRILDREGKPGAYIRIRFGEQRVSADGWVSRESNTDQEGRYRFEGLSAGAHYVSVEGGPDQSAFRNIDLAPGEQKELNFDFSGAIELTGFVTVNGQTPAGKLSHILFHGEGESRTGWIGLGPDGSYKAKVQPGRYSIRPFGPIGAQGYTEMFDIQGGQSQTRNFDIEIVTTDVVLVYPSEDQFETGMTTICTRQRETRYGFIRVDMHQEARQVVALVRGEYIATFTSRSKEWRGESGWVRVGPGEPNEFLLEMKKTTSGVRIGGWSPNQLPMEQFAPLRFDVTPVVQSPGSIQMVLMYEKGLHAVEMISAALLENGNEIARDEHPGWCGIDKSANSYRLELPLLAPGARYEVVFMMRCDGGQDSTGSIYLNLN